MSIIEVKHTEINEGKTQIKTVLEENQNKICVPRTSPEVLQGRWRALHRGDREITGEDARMILATLEAILQQTDVTTQRNVYYTLRGAHPDWKYKGMELKEDKVYEAFTGSIMENIQIFTNRTMQSFGVRAAPRGYVTGDGYIRTKRRGRIQLTSMPTMAFDLVDEAELETQARKIIHFEKDAGFEGIAGQENAIMLEAMYSTSQGYLVEAANKFLADCQKTGLNVYVVHDADPHGLQMQLMYGMASKSNAYMPSSFYPLPRSAVLLGLFPRVANELELPAEGVGETHRKIIPNLRKICEEHPEMAPDVDIIDAKNEQWEFQALNGLSPYAPTVYLIESLRTKGDEIKYVPSDCKTPITDAIKKQLDNYAERKVEDFVQSWFDKENGLKAQIVARIKELLKPEIESFNQKKAEEIAEAESIDPEDYREAVKLELVDDPKRYWNQAAASVVYDMINRKFEIEATPVVDLKLEQAHVETEMEIEAPNVPEQPLTKNDIVASIEKRLVPRAEKRDPLVKKIRNALEKIFGEPDLEW